MIYQCCVIQQDHINSLNLGRAMELFLAYLCNNWQMPVYGPCVDANDFVPVNEYGED
jgi:hypothetical protein